VVLALFFVGVPAAWWAVDQTGVLDITWACGDMDDRAEAQEYLDSKTKHGDEASMKNLDGDGDGKACETHVFDTVASNDRDNGGDLYLGDDGDGGIELGGDDRCHPSYPGECLDPGASDYDCASGDGNGPEYVAGPVEVDWSVDDPDPFDLDSDGDGWACEWG
jgi:hypothetical protein